MQHDQHRKRPVKVVWKRLRPGWKRSSDGVTRETSREHFPASVTADQQPAARPWWAVDRD